MLIRGVQRFVSNIANQQRGRAKKLQKPVLDDKLKVQLQEEFREIVADIYNINRLSLHAGHKVDKTIYIALNERIIREVSAHPLLARAISKDFLNWSLLMTLCSKTHDTWTHPAIVFLIRTNPSSLLWTGSDTKDSARNPIEVIAGHSSHCVLMPWIAQHYGWILDHPNCLEKPPIFKLVSNYTNGGCKEQILRDFFTFYPQSLGQIDEQQETSLHEIIWGLEGCSFDFFKWIIEKHPCSLLHQDHLGWTPLHNACLALSETPTEHVYQICKYLVLMCPQAVRIAGRGNVLPLHILAERYQQQYVQRMILLLLRDYPESYCMSNVRSPNFSVTDYILLSSIPFFQRIKPLLDKEVELSKSILILENEKANFSEALRCSKNTLATVSMGIFNASWTTSQLKVLNDDLCKVSIDLGRICAEFSA